MFDIRIQLDFSARQKQIVRVAAVVAVVIGAIGMGVAAAAPHQWNTSDSLKAVDLNGLNVVAYTSDAGTLRYSVGATKFCGLSNTTTNGVISYAGFTGYVAAKKMCEAVSGCSVTAHMCTGDEIVRNAQLNVAPPGSYGWYAGSYRSEDPNPIVDCSGWTVGVSNNAGPITGQSAWAPTSSSCDQTRYVLCCD